jgi:hypothetical protein
MKKLWSFLTTEFTSYADALTCVGWTTELDKVFYVFIQNERSPHNISSNTVRAPTRPKKKQDEKMYLESLAVAAALTELLDYALELDRAEEVAGPGRPQLYLRHQERSRVAKRIQRGLQTQRPGRPWLVRAVSARIGGCGAREEASEEPAPAAAKAEQAARHREQGGGGHRVAATLPASWEEWFSWKLRELLGLVETESPLTEFFIIIELIGKTSL